MPPIVIAVSLPITCADDLEHDLRDHRVDLAGHDRRALLQLGQEDLADPGARAGAHQREVVRDLGQRDGDDLQRAGQLDERVAVAPAPRTGPRAAGSRGRSARSASRARLAANSGCVLRPVPVAVPPSGICATCGSALRTRLRAEPDLRGVAAELLAERDRHRVHQVRAAGLDDVGELVGLRRERALELLERGQQRVGGLRRARRGARRSGRRRWRTGPCSRGRWGGRPRPRGWR